MTCELRIAYARDAAEPRTTHVVVRRGRRPWLRFFVRSSHGPLRESGDALLCFGLLPALELGCRLRVEVPVDAGLLARAAEVQRLVASWTPGCRPIEVVAPVAAGVGDQSGTADAACGTGVFYSGGVDSAYSLAVHRSQLDGLVTILGCDVRLDDHAGSARLVGIARRAAADAGIESIVVETDLPRRMHPYLGWIEYHGSALAGIRHLLADRFGTMLVAASCDEATAWECPWGSHPGIDPQLGTAAARIEIAGQVVRFDKIARLLSEPTLLRDLRVCYHGGPNCGTCKKCVFTRHCLAVLGVDRPPSFPDGPLPAGPFAASDVGDRDELVALRAAAAAKGGHEPLVAALDAALAAHVRGMASLARRLALSERLRRLRHRSRFLLERRTRAA